MDIAHFCKSQFLFLVILSPLLLVGCSVNPATGRQEFNGLMSREQEQYIGATQHEEIIKEYGGAYNNPSIQAYVNEIGQKMAKFSERQDTAYRFTVLDSPVVNAFALPGGYIYVTRGLLAVANNEAELAGVLGHEIGHVAARHQASRYSQGVLTQLGATVLSAAIGMPAASQAIGVGGQLYMSSYSRGQESESDQLGIRYLSKAGYDVNAMASFLHNMEVYNSTLAQVEGKPKAQYSYFSTHPATGGRIQMASQDAQRYQQNAQVNNGARYISLMRNLTYGDSDSQGFVSNNHFYHPKLNFTFDIPDGARFSNLRDKIVIEGQGGTVLVLDMRPREGAVNAGDFIERIWLEGKSASPIEGIDVNGLNGATTAARTTINNIPAEVRLIALDWDNKDMVRMQILIPQGTSAGAINMMKQTSYSFRRMTSREIQSIKPKRLDIVTARAGDTMTSLAGRMNVDKMHVEQFMALNGLRQGDGVTVGRVYKIIR